MRLASLGIQVGLLVSAFGVGLFCGRQSPATAAADERALMAGAAAQAPAALVAPAAGALGAVPAGAPSESATAASAGDSNAGNDAGERGSSEGRSAPPARAATKSKQARDAKESKDAEPPPEPMSWSRVAARAQSWTAAVRADLNYGAGIVVHTSGLVLTNQHVVANTRSITVTPFGGNPTKAQVVDSDAALDLALLRVELPDPLPHAAVVGSATGLGVGDDVLAVGSPRKMFFSVSRGMVSFPARQLDGVSYIQTDLPINEGNSGGPLVDRQGQVVGVVSFILKESQGLSFALPIDRALERFAPQLRAASQPPEAAQAEARNASEKAAEGAEQARAGDPPKREPPSPPAR